MKSSHIGEDIIVLMMNIALRLSALLSSSRSAECHALLHSTRFTPFSHPPSDGMTSFTRTHVLLGPVPVLPALPTTSQSIQISVPIFIISLSPYIISYYLLNPLPSPDAAEVPPRVKVN